MAKPTKKKRRAAAPIAPTMPGPGDGEGKRASKVIVQTTKPVAEASSGLQKKPSKKQASKTLDLSTLGAPVEVPDPSDRLFRLLVAVRAVGAGQKSSVRTKKLLNSGVPKMAQKVVEEAAETAIDAVLGARVGLINESADLLFNLVVLWSALDVTPADIWAEMDRREATLGLAEKLPKPLDRSDF